MRLLCAHCGILSDWDQYVIKVSEGKFYGGGRAYTAVHRRCKKLMYLSAQMVANRVK